MELGAAEVAASRWIASLRAAVDPSAGESPEVSAGWRRALQQAGRPLKGQEADESSAGGLAVQPPVSSGGGWVDLGDLEGDEFEGDERSQAEAVRLAELLALAEAVRGNTGTDVAVGGVGYVEEEGDASAAVAAATEPKYFNDTAAWSAAGPNQIAQV